MREYWIIGNWKMNLGLVSSLKLANIIAKRYSGSPPESAGKPQQPIVHVIIAPSFTALFPVAKAVEHTDIALAAQNMFSEEAGSYTGEISPLMLTEIGCTHVLIGHSERRQHCGETNSTVNKKVRLALQYDLTPIICVGETWEERNSGIHASKVMEQIRGAVRNITLSNGTRILIAYEPVWAIGSGHAVRPLETKEIYSLLWQCLYEAYSVEEVQKTFRFLYGGSVTASNIGEFMDQEHIYGALIGGASLKSQEFFDIISRVQMRRVPGQVS